MILLSLLWHLIDLFQHVFKWVEHTTQMVAATPAHVKLEMTDGVVPLCLGSQGKSIWTTSSDCDLLFFILIATWLSSLGVLLTVWCVCHQRRYVCTGLHWALDHVRDSVQEARGWRHWDAVLCGAADDLRGGALWWRQVAVFSQVFWLR